MKPFHIAAKFVGALMILATILLVAASFSAVQTRVVRRFLSRSSSGQNEIGRVAIALHRTTVQDLRLTGDGWVLTVPLATLDVSVWPAVRKDLRVRHLVARGWVLDLSRSSRIVSPTVSVRPRDLALPLATLGLAQLDIGSKGENLAVTSDVFRGIFPRLDLPFDLALAQIELEGDLIFRSQTGGPIERVHVVLTGGDLNSRHPGRFNLTGAATMKTSSSAVQTVTADAALQVRLATPRRFDQILLTGQLSAHGPLVAEGATLALVGRLERMEEHERYSFSLQSVRIPANKKLADAVAEFPDAKGRLSGHWTMDARDADLVPFALGFRFPVFVMKGQGSFDAEGTFQEVHTSGSFEGDVDQWEVLASALEPLGELHLRGAFDLFQQGKALRIDRFLAEVSAARPILSLEALQGIEVNLGTGELKVADPQHDLVRLKLAGVPISWLQPYFPGFTLAGDAARGELVGRARSGGLVLRSTGPVTASGLSFSQGTWPLFHDVDLTFGLEAAYGPEGWQTDVSDFSLRAKEGAAWFSASAKMGQPAPAGSATKATGHYEFNLAASRGQPIFGQWGGLTGGMAEGDFSAVLTAALHQFAASAEIKNLKAANAEGTLPTGTILVRADFPATGPVKLQIPFHVQREIQPSDGQLNAEVSRENGMVRFDAQLTGDRLSFEDFGGLVAIFDANKTVTRPSPTPPGPAFVHDTEAPWAGFQGRLLLGLKKIVYAPGLEANDVAGTLDLTPTNVTAEKIQATLPEQGSVLLDARLVCDFQAPHPYALSGELNLSHLNPAPWLVRLSPGRSPMVEGDFDLQGKFSGDAATLDEVGSHLTEEAKLTSRGGKFRGFAASSQAVDLEKFQKAASTVGAIFQAAAGIVGYGEGVSYSDKIRAAGESLRGFAEINFDQLNLELSHQPGQKTMINNLGLISPEIRFSGSGQIDTPNGSSWFEQPLHLDVAVGVRGRQAEDLKKLGLTVGQKDSLGYVALLDNFPIDGSVEDLTTDVLTQLLNRALSK